MKHFATKFYCSLAMLFTTICSHAQMPYTQFIESKHISWAASYNGSIVFDSINLNLLLRERFAKKEIKAASPEKLEFEKNIQYQSVEEIEKRIDPTFEKGNKTSSSPLFSEKYFNVDVNKQVGLQQIFYVEKGVLKSSISSAAPLFTVITQAGTLLGTSKAFLTAINPRQNVKRSVQRKGTVLGTTTVRQEDLVTEKQVYRLDLHACIWPYLDKKYDIIRLDSNKTIDVQDVNIILDRIEVPVYDEEGNLSHTTIVSPVFSPESFTVGEIEQEWFYSKKKNIVFVKIRSLTLNFSKKPVLKIVLK